jgi:outer membrane protein
MNQLHKFRYLFFIGLFVLSVNAAFADHPSQGSLTLEQLLKEGGEQNLEIKEAESNLKSSNQEANSKFGPYMPQLSIEGGPLSTNHEGEKNSGTSVYGKAGWNLYRGGRDSGEIEKAKIASQLEQKRLESVRAKISREISRVYYELLFFLESSDLKRKAIEMNQEQMKLGKLKKSSGFTSSADVIEFELRDATLKSDLKMHEQEVLEKSRELSVLLGRKDSSTPLVVKGHLTRDTSINLNREAVIARLPNSNIDIAEAQAEIQMSKMEAQVAKSGFLPSVDVEATYGKLANDERVFAGNDNYSVALKVSIPLFSGFETLNQTRSARSKVVAKENAVSRKNLSAVAETDNLFSKLATLNDRLNLEEKNLSKSEEYYKITVGEYRRGVKNSPDMVGASERLVEARIRNLEYRKDYYLTKLKIYELVSGHPN